MNNAKLIILVSNKNQYNFSMSVKNKLVTLIIDVLLNFRRFGCLVSHCKKNEVSNLFIFTENVCYRDSQPRLTTNMTEQCEDFNHIFLLMLTILKLLYFKAILKIFLMKLFVKKF